MAGVLQLCLVEVEDINNTYSQKRKDVIMSATTITKYRERKRKKREERRKKRREGKKVIK